MVLFFIKCEMITVTYIFTFSVFKKEPPIPPSVAQLAAVQRASHEDYLASLKRLFQNPGFMLLTLTYGKTIFGRRLRCPVFLNEIL